MYSIGELRLLSESVDNKSSVNLQPIHSACYSGSKVEVTKPKRKLALVNPNKSVLPIVRFLMSWCSRVEDSREWVRVDCIRKGVEHEERHGVICSRKCYIFTYIFRKKLRHFLIFHGFLETTGYFNKYGFKPAINIWRIILHLFAIFCSDCLHRHYLVLLKVAKQAR